MLNKKLAGIFIVLSLSSFFVNGQKLINSPYSRFNIGALEPVSTFKSQGMGGVSSSLRDISSIFYTNPASYSSLDTTSSVFDFGLDYSMNYITTPSGESYFSDDINFDHVMIGFPIRRGWGLSFGVVPVSNGYYKLYNTVTKTDPEYDPITGAYTSVHTGEGSLSNFYLGTGFKILKNLSVGVNMTVLFGILDKKYDVTFSDFMTTFHNNAKESMQLGGVNFDYGIQYHKVSAKNRFLNVGASLTTGHEYNSDYSSLSYKSTAYGGLDTINFVRNENEKAFMPGTIRGGFAFGKINKFTAAFEYVYTTWSELALPGLNGYSADTRTYHFGLEYIPEKYSNYSFARRIEYRLGAHFGDDYLIIDGVQLKELGASFGAGIPMGLSLADKRSLSRINLIFDYSRRYGPSSSNFHNENYFTFGVSLNLYDFWFVQRKYD